MPAMRKLIRPTVVFAGPTLHGGGRARAQILPATPGTGIRLVRIDRSPPTTIPADLSAVELTSRRTVIAAGGTRVSTVEHLLAALVGVGIADAEIHVSGNEIPILDGSAAPFVSALLAASEPLGVPPDGPGWVVTRASSMRAGEGQCHLLPCDAEAVVIECEVDFAHPWIGHQRARLDLARTSASLFAARFAPARTFGRLDEAALLRGQGLAAGATLGNVLVFGPNGVLNPGGMRFRDEPVRHKVLDALGDLALLGGGLQGRLRLRHCSHRLLLEALRRGCAEGALARR